MRYFSEKNISKKYVSMVKMEIFLLGKIIIYSDPNTPKIGFSAQQVVSILPETVYDTKEKIDSDGNLIVDNISTTGIGTTSDEYVESVGIGTTSEENVPTKLGMEYVSIIPVIVKALQEISDRLDQIELHVGIAST